MLSETVKRLARTTGFRLVLWYSAIFISSSLVLFTLLYFPLRSAILEKDRNIVLTKLKEYALQDQQAGFRAMLNEIRLEDAHNQQSGFFVRVADPRDATLALTLPPDWPRLDLQQAVFTVPSDGRAQWSALPLPDSEELEIASQRLQDGYLLQVGRGSEERHKLLDHFRDIFGAIMLPVILIGFAGGYFLAFRSLRPVRDLIQTVRSIDTGRMDARVPSRETGDELDELIRLFNGMLEKIETLLTGMRSALDNVAHDLKTPLTRVRAVIETTLQAENADAATLREALMDCAEESERLVTMLNTLMDISEAETGVMHLQLEPVNIASLLSEVVELYGYVAEEEEIRILTAVPDILYAHADRNRLRQVIANLLDNAVKYTPAKGRITIQAGRREGHLVLTIEDTGIGIPSHDLPRIFDRLYRGDTSRSQRGLGLGLSLVKAVVQAHNGRITVESRSGNGARFSLLLPLNPAHRET